MATYKVLVFGNMFEEVRVVEMTSEEIQQNICIYYGKAYYKKCLQENLPWMNVYNATIEDLYDYGLVINV